MTFIMQSIHKFEKRFDQCAEHFVFHHPYIAFFTILVGIPIFILIAVTLFTVSITLPISWLMGWV